MKKIKKKVLLLGIAKLIRLIFVLVVLGPLVVFGQDDSVEQESIIYPFAHFNIGKANNKEEEIKEIAFLPDGKLLAVGSGTGIWLYNISNLTPIGFLNTAEDYLGRKRISMPIIIFSPDSKLVALKTFRGFKFWNVALQKEVDTYTLPELRGHELEEIKRFASYLLLSPESYALSPDWKLIGRKWGDEIYLWDITSQREIGSIQREYYIQCFAFHPNKKLLAVARAEPSSKKVLAIISFWEFGPQYYKNRLKKEFSAKKISSFQISKKYTDERLEFITFDLTGKFLGLISDGGDVHLWDIASRKEITVFKRTHFYTSFALSPDLKWLASGESYRDYTDTKRWGIERSRIHLWNIISGRKFALLEGADDSTIITFDHACRLVASGDKKGNIFLWNVSEFTVY
jgi:WD40 repeat protein